MEAEEILKKLKKMLREHQVIYSKTVKTALENKAYWLVSFNAGEEDAYTSITDYIKYLENGEK